MPTKSRKESSDATWKTQWPRNGDLETWLRTMLRKCEAIADDEAAAEMAHLPITNLAEKGHVAGSLKYVNRFLRRLPNELVMERVRMAELGAEICLDANDLVGMEQYLAVATATEPFITRKCDKGSSVKSVREFRVRKGLLNPDDALDDAERLTTQFEGAARRCRQATDAGQLEAAKAAAAQMETLAREPKEHWRRRAWLQRTIRLHAELKDAEGVKRSVSGLEQAERDRILTAALFDRIGMKKEAVAQAEKEIEQKLQELAHKQDPNIHFPVGHIGRALELLVANGAKGTAKRLLERTLSEMSTWPVYEHGWLTSGVYQILAEAVAKIDGPAAAEELLNHAMKDATTEKRSDWRKGAIDGVLKVKANIGQWDRAIAEARKLRSPTQRRKELGKLLARAERWTELREVLSEVASPEEAADTMWWIKFELPGGAVS